MLRGAWRLEPLAEAVTATVRMRLPVGVVPDAAVSTGVAWDAATGTVEWRAVTLPRGGARALPFTLQIADDAPAGRAEITTEFLVEAAGFRATRRDALNVGNYNVHTGVSRAQGGRQPTTDDGRQLISNTAFGAALQSGAMC